jgi:hypothetical protein
VRGTSRAIVNADQFNVRRTSKSGVPPISAVFLPPLVALPLVALFLSIVFRREQGSFIPGGSIRKFGRLLCVAYGFLLIAHATYGGVIFWLARKIGVIHLLAWVALYSGAPLVIGLIASNTTSGMRDDSVYVAIVVLISGASWFLIRNQLGMRLS